MSLRSSAPRTETHRRVSGSLSKQAHWVMTELSDHRLEAAQLPKVVPTKKETDFKAGTLVEELHHTGVAGSGGCIPWDVKIDAPVYLSH